MQGTNRTLLLVLDNSDVDTINILVVNPSQYKDLRGTLLWFQTG